MKFTYQIGERVCSRSEPNKAGAVEELLDDDGDELRVNWDDIGSRWCEARDIMPDTDEARQQLVDLHKQVQAKVDEATSALEVAFKAWQEAASLIAGHDGAEAYYLRHNKEVDLSKFEGVIEQNGWSTSSLYC